MIAAALRSALSDRARDGRIHVVESFVTGEKPSTKAALKALETVGGARVLVVLTRDEELAWLSLRNVATIHVLAYDQLNAYDVVVADDIVFSRAALDAYVAGPTQGKPVKAVATESEAEAEAAEAEAKPAKPTKAAAEKAEAKPAKAKAKAEKADDEKAEEADK